MRHRLWLVLALVASIAPGASAQQVPSRDDVIVIDGSKNPEMIPQWAAWEDAFRVMHGGPAGAVPSEIHRVASRQERLLIRAEAAANETRYRACRERIEKLAPLVGKEKLDVLLAKQREIHLDCRWQTLHARDRLLERLRPEVQTELMAFVEGGIPGMTVTLSKKELPFYRQPQ